MTKLRAAEIRTVCVLVARDLLVCGAPLERRGDRDADLAAETVVAAGSPRGSLGGGTVGKKPLDGRA